MSETETWQVNAEAAEVYEREFVPAIFGEWAGRVCDAANVSAGDAVLDVACGTGVVAREALQRGANATGIDLNDGMLTVARREAPLGRFERGDAVDLSFGAGSFDKTLCQFAFMYLADRERALREMARVTRPGGVMCIAVWGRLDQSPGYEILAGIAQRATDASTAAMLRSPFVLGDPGALAEIFASAGLADPRIDTHVGTVRFASIDEFVRAEVDGSPLAETLGSEGVDALLAEARVGLAPFCAADGLRFPVSAHIARADVRA